METRIIFISGREPGYMRNAVILKGLRENGVDVIECTNASKSYLVRYPKVVGKFVLQNKNDCDAVFIGYFSQPLVSIIRKLTPSAKPIIFDAFLSAYDTMCFDRKKFRPESLMGKYFYRLDKHSCELADKVLLDTNAHIDYFVNTFGLEREKFQRVFMGADDSIFYPGKEERNKDKFRVVFFGTYIPLHGIEYIVEAAKLLENNEDIEFEIFGSGQTYKDILDLSKKLKIKNISFKKEWITKNPQKYLTNSDVCLGIFGNTQKARRVIAEKAFEVIAMKKPLITGDTPAAREVFSNKENAILCEMANPKAIAEAILLLKEDEKLRKRIAENGYRLFKEKFTPQAIGKEVKIIIEEVIKN